MQTADQNGIVKAPDATKHEAGIADERWILRLAGNFSRDRAASVWQSACEGIETPAPARLDFQETPQCDVSVLQVLLALDAKLREEGRDLDVQGISEHLEQHFTSLGCTSFIKRERK